MADNADIADLNPAFRARLDPFLAALTKAGINANVISGYRSPELQSRLYANYQAKQAGRPLPFPQENQGAIAAPPWRSFHNYGLAADITPSNPADYQRMWGMAPQYGLTALGAKDLPHFQMGGDLASDIAQYHLANWRPASQPAPATGAIAYSAPTGQPSRVATTAPGTSLNSSPMDLVANLESGNRNIKQGIVDANTAKGTPAGGFFQIIDPTWRTYATKAGIDLSQYPTAMSAPRDIQAKVASAIPVNQWGPNTVNALKAKYPGLDTSQTLGQWQSAAINPQGASTTPAGGAGAPAAPAPSGGLAGQLATALKPLTPGGKGAGGDVGQADEPQPMRLPQAPMAQAVGGPMMMGQGGQNVMGQRIAQNDLAQRGFSMQPQLASAYGALGATKPVVQPIMPGQASGMPGLPGTTLNSPSQLQMALMSGQISPYDMYANNPAFGSGFGST